jgi:hypothetical protein
VVGGNGLECDKLSREAMDAQFAGMMGKLVRAAGPLAGKVLTATHIDSWEVGGQDWTPRFSGEFFKRRGYDPLPWLPCVTEKARDVGGKEMADRFRWDFDQTISELLAENYAGRLDELAQQHGLRLSIEGYDLNDFGDEATYVARADEPMSEFWTAGHPGPGWGTEETLLKAREMASVAHIHGRPILGAEAFTSDDTEAWKKYPATIKSLGDYEFSQGINRFVIHRYAHQPYLDRAPGVTMGPWGLHYERTETWWEMSKPWHEYLARCQFLLRQGKWVADLCYVRPEIPHQTYFTPTPPAPAGYRYDECSAEDVLKLMTVKNGRIVVPCGMSYALLVAPPQTKAMTPALLQKINELVEAGATVLLNGPPPKTSPSLANFPQCDEKAARLASELWGDADGMKVTEHTLARGKVIWGEPLDKVLTSLRRPPDFTSDVALNWIHRRAGGVEIYFVASRATDTVAARCTFRVAGKAPEFWNPQTGERHFAAAYTQSNGLTIVPMEFEPGGSWFIVFRKPAARHPSTAASNSLAFQPLMELDHAWQVAFDPKWGGPEAVEFDHLSNWADRPEPGIKFYSGTATYTRTFDWHPESNQKSTILLDLGTVDVMAQVNLNGRDCGEAWTPPYRVDITRALKTGVNTLAIRVVNLWPNRMIGDAALPKNQRLTWSSWEPFKADTPLLPSGLLGPVKILELKGTGQR